MMEGMEELTFGINSAKENFDNSVSSVVAKYVKEQIEALIKPETLVKFIEESGVVSQLVRQHFSKWTINEVGNRLRCGIYDGTTVNRVFESIWNEQFDIDCR